MFQLDNMLVHELFLTLTPELIARKSHVAIYRKVFKINLKEKPKQKIEILVCFPCYNPKTMFSLRNILYFYFATLFSAFCRYFCKPQSI